MSYGIDASTAIVPIPRVLLRGEPRQYGFSEDFVVLALRLSGCTVHVSELNSDRTEVLRDDHLDPIVGFPIPEYIDQDVMDQFWARMGTSFNAAAHKNSSS